MDFVNKGRNPIGWMHKISASDLVILIIVALSEAKIEEKPLQFCPGRTILEGNKIRTKKAKKRFTMTARKEKTYEKIHSGSLYVCSDEEILADQALCLERLYDYNHTRPSEGEKRQALLKEMFAEIGENCYIEPPLHANWGGHNVRFSKNVYANFGLTLVDDTEITVGDFCMFGPGVIVATAGHPICPALREQVYQYNLPVHIGKNVWIGAGAVILPGVTIGDDTVIGAGSVVTKDVPAGVVAVGNPCRVLRPITEEDRLFYKKGMPIPKELRNGLEE